MDPIHAVILGIVQGLTEFLPISSSGHLILVPWLLDINYLEAHPKFHKTFDVALHLGTLLGVVLYFRTETKQIIRGTLSIAKKRRVETANDRLALMIILATIPAVVVGFTGEDFIDSRLGEPWQIAILLIIFGLVLAWADRRPAERKFDQLTTKEAVKIGFAQSLALAPGISRSGVTISAGRALGLDRDSAARFSFLLLLPATAGAVVLKGAKVVTDGLPAGSTLPLILGVISSAITGYFAIKWLLKFVRSRSYDIFVGYRLFVGLGVFILIASGLKNATF